MQCVGCGTELTTKHKSVYAVLRFYEQHNIPYRVTGGQICIMCQTYLSTTIGKIPIDHESGARHYALRVVAGEIEENYGQESTSDQRGTDAAGETCCVS